jgi:hypothetical protein
MKRILVSLFAILFLVGCADSHQLIRHDSAAAGRLTAADSIYIAVSADGVYGPGLRGRLLYPMPRARTPARRKLLTLKALFGHIVILEPAGSAVPRAGSEA